MGHLPPIAIVAFLALSALAGPRPVLASDEGAREPGCLEHAMNELHYLGLANESSLGTWVGIDPVLGRVLGMIDAGASPARTGSLGTYSETRAALAREQAQQRHGYFYSGAGVWDNAGGREVDAATFARHWARGEIAHGGPSPASGIPPGHHVNSLWPAFVLPRAAFEASTRKMAFLDAIAGNETLRGNPSLLKLITAERDRFAAQVQRGLRGLAQDLTFVRANFVEDPLRGPRRIFSIQENLRLITGRSSRESLLRSIQDRSAILRLTPAQSRELVRTASGTPRWMELDPAIEASFVNHLMGTTLQKQASYPRDWVDYLIADYDPVRHPRTLVELRPGDQVEIGGEEGVFRGLQNDRIVFEASGDTFRLPLSSLGRQLKRRFPDSVFGSLSPGNRRVWSVFDGFGGNGEIPIRIGRVRSLEPVGKHGEAILFEAPDGSVQRISSNDNWRREQRTFLQLDPESAGRRAFEEGEVDQGAAWISIKTDSGHPVSLEREGPAQFVVFNDGRTREATRGRLVDAGIGNGARGYGGFARVELPDGRIVSLGAEEASTLARQGSPAAAIAEFIDRLPPARRDVVRRFQGGKTDAFPDRSLVEMHVGREEGGSREFVFTHHPARFAMSEKGKVNASAALPAEAPYAGLPLRRYLVDEYIEMPVDRARIERLVPGTRYAWVLLSDGQLRIAPQARVRNAQAALAEGANVLSAGSLTYEGGRLHVMVGDAPAYYVGRSEMPRLLKEASHVGHAFETLAGTRPASVGVHVNADPVPPGGRGGHYLVSGVPELVHALRQGKALTPAQRELHARTLSTVKNSGWMPDAYRDSPIALDLSYLLKDDFELFENNIRQTLLDSKAHRSRLAADESLRREVLRHLLAHPRPKTAAEFCEQFPWDLSRQEERQAIAKLYASENPEVAAAARAVLEGFARDQPAAFSRDFPAIAGRFDLGDFPEFLFDADDQFKPGGGWEVKGPRSDAFLGLLRYSGNGPSPASMALLDEALRAPLVDRRSRVESIYRFALESGGKLRETVLRRLRHPLPGDRPAAIFRLVFGKAARRSRQILEGEPGVLPPWVIRSMSALEGQGTRKTIQEYFILERILQEVDDTRLAALERARGLEAGSDAQMAALRAGGFKEDEISALLVSKLLDAKAH